MVISRLNGSDGTNLKVTTNLIVTVIIDKMRAAQEGILLWTELICYVLLLTIM